jgi:surface antigen
MLQFSNHSISKPQVDDLLVFGAAPFNEYGHVAVISKVASDHIEIAQQNPGKGNPSRSKYGMSQSSGKWTIDNEYVAGWLRMP